MNNFYKTPVFLLFSIYVIFGLLYEAYLWTLPTHTTVWNYGINFVYGTTFVAGGMYGIYHALKLGIASSIGRAISLIGFGLCSWGLGLYLWMYYNIVLHIPVPYPSWVDPLFLAFYFLLGSGVTILIKLFSPAIKGRIILDSIVIGLVSAGVIIFLMRPDLSDSLPFLVKILNVMYPLGTAILIALTLIIIRIGGGSIRNSFPLFVIGLFLHALGAFLYGYRITNGTYWNGDITDITVLVAIYFLSVGLAKIIYDHTAQPKPTSS